MKLWYWIKKNSESIQEIDKLGKIIIGAIGGLIVVLVFLWSIATPKIIILSKLNESTIPKDLIMWSNEVARALQVLPPQQENEASVISRLRQLAASEVAKNLHLDTPEKINQFILVLKNNTEHTVSGARLRVGNVGRRFWSVGVKGTFLTEGEANTFAQQVKPSSNSYDFHHRTLFFY